MPFQPAPSYYYPYARPMSPRRYDRHDRPHEADRRRFEDFYRFGEMTRSRNHSPDYRPMGHPDVLMKDAEPTATVSKSDFPELPKPAKGNFC